MLLLYFIFFNTKSGITVNNKLASLLQIGSNISPDIKITFLNISSNSKLYVFLMLSIGLGFVSWNLCIINIIVVFIFVVNAFCDFPSINNHKIKVYSVNYMQIQFLRWTIMFKVLYYFKIYVRLQKCVTSKFSILNQMLRHYRT